MRVGVSKRLRLSPPGSAYTCLEAATGRALLRQHMDNTGEDHPLNKLRVVIEPGPWQPPQAVLVVPEAARGSAPCGKGESARSAEQQMGCERFPFSPARRQPG